MRPVRGPRTCDSGPAALAVLHTGCCSPCSSGALRPQSELLKPRTAPPPLLPRRTNQYYWQCKPDPKAAVPAGLISAGGESRLATRAQVLAARFFGEWQHGGTSCSAATC